MFNITNIATTIYFLLLKTKIRNVSNLVKKLTIIKELVKLKIKLLLTVYYYHVTYDFQSESILHSVPECQGTPCSKQVEYMTFK